MVTARAAIAAAAEYRWIASDLIKQPPAMTMARTMPSSRPGNRRPIWCFLQQIETQAKYCGFYLFIKKDLY
jgi:hypothetical protein